MFDTKAVEDALEILALAYIEERRKPIPQKPEGITMTPFHFDDGRPLKTRKTIYREQIIKRPIEGALRFAIRELGEHAHANGVSLNGMLDMLETVAARNPTREQSILSTVDHAWDGIGSAKDKPGWCC